MAPPMAGGISPGGGRRRVTSPSDGSDLHHPFSDPPAMPEDEETVSLLDVTLSNIVDDDSLPLRLSTALVASTAPQFAIDMLHRQAVRPPSDVDIGEYSFPEEWFLPAEAFDRFGAIVDNARFVKLATNVFSSNRLD